MFHFKNKQVTLLEKQKAVRRVFIYTSPRSNSAGVYRNAPSNNVVGRPRERDVLCCITAVVPFSIPIYWNGTTIYHWNIHLCCMHSYLSRPKPWILLTLLIFVSLDWWICRKNLSHINHFMLGYSFFNVTKQNLILYFLDKYIIIKMRLLLLG